MNKSYFCCILLFSFFLSTGLQSQTLVEKYPDPFKNKVILSHYSVSQLQQIHATDSMKFNVINYYYNQSFIIEHVDCVNCTPINLTDFDITQYEHLRKRHERVTHSFYKFGFKLTLLSIDELTYKLPIHNQ